MGNEELDWNVKPVVTLKGQESDSYNSGGCIRVSGVGHDNTPATKIWYGEVTNEPGYCSLPHHHGECETGGRVVKGKGRIYFGEGFKEWIDMVEGDWVFVPPYMPHVECNMSTTEQLVWMTCRTPDNIVVNLPDVDDSELEGYSRA